jgi:hypothetical protein
MVINAMGGGWFQLRSDWWWFLLSVVAVILVDKIRRMEPAGSTVDLRFRPFRPESSV